MLEAFSWLCFARKPRHTEEEKGQRKIARTKRLQTFPIMNNAARNPLAWKCLCVSGYFLKLSNRKWNYWAKWYKHSQAFTYTLPSRKLSVNKSVYLSH